MPDDGIERVNMVLTYVLAPLVCALLVAAVAWWRVGV